MRGRVNDLEENEQRRWEVLVEHLAVTHLKPEEILTAIKADVSRRQNAILNANSGTTYVPAEIFRLKCADRILRETGRIMANIAEELELKKIREAEERQYYDYEDIHR